MPLYKEPIFELAIDLPPRGSRRRSQALYGQLRTAIVDGRLQAGLHLPPTRTLASMLGVGRNAAVAAYESLVSEGYLLSRQGAGTYVARIHSRRPEQSVPTTDSTRERRLNAFWRKAAGPLTKPSKLQPLQFNFLPGMPDKALFPFEIWRRLSARALRKLARAPADLNLEGRPELREAIATHISMARAVACRSEDVVITTGAQQAFDLLARILVTKGRTTVAVEEPGYPLLRQAFKSAGAQLVPIRVDDEGLDVERLPRNAHVICVTPSHQYPLGTVMSLRRRMALIEFARARGAVIIEDDYDGEFRLGGQPIDALQTLDRSGCVFYVGTFSKCLYPDIRMGFVVTPPWARRTLMAAKLYTDFVSPVHSQVTLASFIAEGHLARHVRKMRRIYAERRQVLSDALHEHFNGLLEPIPFPAGLHLTAWTKSTADEDRIVERASQHGIGLISLRSFYSGRIAKPGLIFGYGAIDKQSITEGLMRLRRLLGQRRTT